MRYKLTPHPKKHWRPLEPVSWPSGRARLFHTGYAAICSTPNASDVERDIAFVTCGTCLRRAFRARFDKTGQPVPCVAHDDCRKLRSLGLACAQTRQPKVPSMLDCTSHPISPGQGDQ